MTDILDYKDPWDLSYGRGENHVFWPTDELVRFVSRHIRRRVGLDEVVDVFPGAEGSRVLDAGCGIGRHLVFGHDMGLEMHGMDLSHIAVARARDWLRRVGVADAEARVQQADIRAMPWSDGYFAHALSEAALDSMPFEVARQGVAEIARVTRPGGFFYCSLISGDETGRNPDFAGDVLVEDGFEQDTIQAYFNRRRVDELLGEAFETVSATLIQACDADSGRHASRWYYVGRRRG